jgi:response regulator RpfG family c-di-GMP phosphodiesterase/signal transduction histidine kinase
MRERRTQKTSVFDADLLAGFESETVRKASSDTRLATIVAAISFSFFGILDYFVYAQLFRIFIFIRLIVVISNMGIYLLTMTGFGKRFPRELGMAGYCICCLSIVLMVHLTGDAASPYYAGVSLVLIVFLAVLPLDLTRTAIISLIVYASYVVPMIALKRVNHLAPLLNNNFFLLCTIALVILSSHHATQLRFLEFSARFGLARANEKLKKLDTLKSQFFANVSHEVRTPLTSILSPVQSLYQGDLGPLDPEHQRLIGQIYRNALKLLDMINQMLDFSKFEARKMQLRLKHLDIEELAQDIVTTFQEVAARKALKLRYVTEGELQPAYLDAEKLERILTNLVRNAIKFTESGSITVKAGSSLRGRWIEVRDTGIGIPSQHLAHIFDRFQQVDSSSTRRYEGTGLGLTIVKESVEIMQGSVQVQSEEKRGTTFRVELPGNLDQLAPDAFIERRVDPERRQPEEGFDGADRRRKPRRESDLARLSLDDLAIIERDMIGRGQEESLVPPTAANASSDRVLLVEDNIDLRAYVSKMLSRLGHHVTTAIDGLDGWEHVQTDLPDLVISDVMMPRMDGYELVSRIKSTDKTRQIPVILITAKPELESKLEGLEKGADDYLPKPVNIRELDARIKNLLVTRNLQRALAREAELGAKMEELSMSFSQSLEIRDFNTAGHSRDVLQLGSIIAEEIGLPIDRMLKDSLLLHDIGKLGIPDRILLKESPLTEEEWTVMKTHPELGASLLGHFESYREVSTIILAHQEHFDGSGYPRGLKGDEIPLLARIIAIADAYHAMISNRPYRKALPASKAVHEMTRNRGTQFDAALVDAFIKGLAQQNIVSADVL